MCLYWILRRGCSHLAEKTSNNDEFKIYDTFICYRGDSVGHSASKEIAGAIYSMIRDDKERFGNVFFAGDPNVKYNYNDDASRIIQNIKRFIIVLCTDFFDRFFDEKSDPSDPKSNDASATCHELKYALESGCDIIPLFSGEFSWDKVDESTINLLEAHYGKDGFGKLKYCANVYRWKQAQNDPQ